MNLVINASEAMHKSGGSIVVKTGSMQVDDAYLASSLHKIDTSVGRFIYMEVTDSVCGMDL